MQKQHKVLLLNGPNINMLGIREPEKYGSESLSKIVLRLQKQSEHNGFEFEHFQSNAESALIDRIHQAFNHVDFIIFNPAAFTHTSIALRDAILSVSIPFIEVHLSNVHTREPFRHHSYFSDIAKGVICGLGSQGYDFALDYAARYLNNLNV